MIKDCRLSVSHAFSRTVLRSNQATSSGQWQMGKGKSIGKSSNPLFWYNDCRNNVFDRRLNYPCAHIVGFQGQWKYLVSWDWCRFVPVNPDCAEKLAQPGFSQIHRNSLSEVLLLGKMPSKFNCSLDAASCKRWGTQHWEHVNYVTSSKTSSNAAAATSRFHVYM